MLARPLSERTQRPLKREFNSLRVGAQFPDQNPFPVEDIPPEPDLDSVKEVLRNRLLIHRLGQGRTVSGDEIALIIDRKEKILSRMFELDSNPFWNQRKKRLVIWTTRLQKKIPHHTKVIAINY